jgi:NADPH:quinone reductase
VPSGVPDEAAAQLFVNPLTGLLMLEELGLREGAWLLQTAGTSQVGRVVVQLARSAGVRTISVVRRESAVVELEALGAEHVIVADAEGDAHAVRARVDELTAGRGADGALDGVAGGIGGVVARSLAEGATMLVYGGLSGSPLSIDAGTLIFKRVTIRGFWRTRWFETHTIDETRRRMDRLATLVASGDLVLPVEATYDLADFTDAIAHSRRAGTSGKVLLTG